MFLGAAIGAFAFYVILPVIGWVFNLGPKPTKIGYIDYTKQLEQTRKWLSSLNDDCDCMDGLFDRYNIPDEQNNND